MEFKVLFQLRSIDFFLYDSHQFKTLLIKCPQKRKLLPLRKLTRVMISGVEYSNHIPHTSLQAYQTLTIGNTFYL